MTRRRRRVVGLLVALVAAGCSGGGSAPDQPGSTAPSATQAVTPPTQPAQGAGGSQRRHAGARQTQVGGSPGEVTIFEPAKPAPKSAQVVVFTQGVGPQEYQGWIDHLVGRGSIVVFQNQPFDTVDLTQRRKGPLAGLRAAMRALARPGHVRSRWDQLVLVGHSVGGNMAAQLAADTATKRLPRPTAVFAVQPRPEDEASLRVLRGIPGSTRVLVLAGDRDDRVGQEGPKALWAALGHLPAASKDYVLVRSDAHGAPPLVADHFLPLSGSGYPADALDFYGPWKLLDALQACATRQQDCRVALGGTAQQRFMGRWSDGVPGHPAASHRHPMSGRRTRPARSRHGRPRERGCGIPASTPSRSSWSAGVQRGLALEATRSRGDLPFGSNWASITLNRYTSSNMAKEYGWCIPL